MGSPIEHECICPRCLAPVELDGPLRCTYPRADGCPGGCGWSSMSARDTVRSGRTRPNQDTPFR